MKMEIALDEKKVEQNGYSADEIYNQLDVIFERLNIKKVSKGVYEGKGTPQDYGNFGGIVIKLSKRDWFMPFATKWIWDTGTGTEDVLAYHKKRYGASA